MRIRTLFAGLVVAGLALPSASHAVQATISNESGTDVPLGAPTTITNMAPVLKLQFTPEEKRFAVLVTAPDGVTAAATQACVGIASYRDLVVNYAGNGKYTVTITSSTDPTDAECTNPLGTTTSTAQFTVAAAATVGAPTGRVLTRRPDAQDFKTHTATIGASPGTDTIEFRYAHNVTPKADGSLPGTPDGGVYPADQATAPMSFDRPGRWAIVARPRLGTGLGPWSAPVFVDVQSPFDLVGPMEVNDRKAPAYTFKGDVAAGIPKGATIKVFIAKGKKGGKFRKLNAVKTKRNGHFKVKLVQPESGRYRLRMRYKGDELIHRGHVTQAIKIGSATI